MKLARALNGLFEERSEDLLAVQDWFEGGKRAAFANPNLKPTFQASYLMRSKTTPGRRQEVLTSSSKVPSHGVPRKEFFTLSVSPEEKPCLTFRSTLWRLAHIGLYSSCITEKHIQIASTLRSNLTVRLTSAISATNQLDPAGRAVNVLRAVLRGH